MNTEGLDIYVGQKIKARRNELGWRQRDLATKLRLSHQQIQKYETGETRIPLSLLYELAHILSFDFSDFFSGFSSTSVPKKKMNIPKKSAVPTSTVHEFTSIFCSLPSDVRKNVMNLMRSLNLRNKA